MREAMIICPVNDNNGSPIGTLIQRVMKRLANTFGGCTTVDANGSWIDRGHLYVEPVKQVIAAYKPSPENDARLRAIAIEFGYAAKQLAMFVRYASGECEVIEAIQYAQAAE